MKLFERTKIGSMEVRNRVAMAPMGTNGLADMDCGYSRRLIDFYEARAAGGCGMIMTGAAVVNTVLEGGIAHFLPRLDSPAYMGRLNELVDAVHHHGAKLVLQLTAGFGRVNFVANNPLQPIGPSAGVACFLDPSVSTRELTKEEIGQIVVSYATAVGMAAIAGVDAISIQGYGGYLIDQFMSSLWNKRDDEYGGDLDRRMRFAMEIIGATRAAAGPNMPIIFKFTPDHLIEGGRTLEEGLAIAKRLEAAGVQALHVDAGCYEVWHRVVPSMYEAAGCQVDLAAEVRKVVNIPVITHGKLGDPLLAERVVQEGKADFIALGRAVLADPEWCKKAKAKQYEEIRPCISCNQACIARGYQMKYLSCTVNPITGMEKRFALTPATKKKKVLVIGGGPGGLEAARVAAVRGMDVTLWEKDDKLGGRLNVAEVPEFKKDLRPLNRYLAEQVKKAGVTVKLGKRADAAHVRDFAPDVLIVATGSRFRPPPVPGVDGAHVMSSAALLGHEKTPGHTIVVVGGGLCGCEVAVYLAQEGREVTLIEMADQLVPEGADVNTMLAIQALLADSKIEVRTGTKLLEIRVDGVLAESGGKPVEITGDTVVIATGYSPDLSVRDELEDLAPELYLVGDCTRPRNILNAIWEGFHAGRVM